MNTIIRKTESVLGGYEKTLLSNTLAKLDEYYPERKTYAMDALCPSVRESCNKLGRFLGYAGTSEFLEAYGYEMISGDAVYAIRKNCGFNNPGKEPELIKNRVEYSVKSLQEFYPNHVIEGSLKKSHKSLSETIGGLYQWLGYKSVSDFLQAYGFSYEIRAGGRPSSVDPSAITARLKEMYPQGTLMSLGELQKANPDIPWKSLQKKSMEYFGMNLSSHLAYEGILISRKSISLNGLSAKNQVTELISALAMRYEGKNMPSELRVLIAENPDLPIAGLNKISGKLFFKIRRVSDVNRLAVIEKALLEKYEGKAELPETVAQVIQENKELELSTIQILAKKVKGLSTKEYFTSIGILPVEKTPEEKLEELVSVLKERYVGTGKKAYTTSDLSTQNPDLAIPSLQKLVKTVHNKTKKEYLLELGILTESDWQAAYRMEQERIAAQETAQQESFKNDRAFDDLYRFYLESYKTQTDDNPCFDIKWGSSDTYEITLPDTVRAIRHRYYGFMSKFKMNIPCGYLLQKRKLPIEPLETLLRSVWKYDASMLDWVSIYVYQNSKQLNGYCTRVFSKAPNAFVAAALVIFNGKCKSSDVDRVGEVVFDLRKEIAQEFLDNFYVFAKDHQAKKAVSTLMPFVTAEAGGELNAIKIYKNELEKFCDNNFEKHEFERIMQKAGLADIVFEKSGVNYVGRDEEVSAFVLACAIVPYIGQLTERPRDIRNYEIGLSDFTILEKCDHIVAQFERSSFDSFIDRLTKLANGYETPQIWIPVCRFGTGNQIKTLISSMNLWSNWYSCGAKGRSGIIVCRGAIMLSDTREAMIYAEKCKELHYYAKLRGMNEETIRNTKLADFGFNEDGKKIYNIGSTIIEASVGDDLTIVLYDTVASKFVKSLPKKGSDSVKYDVCSADYAELKKNVKKVVKTRNDVLFEYFLSGKKFNCASWKAAYSGNPVLHKVAKLLVWAQGIQTFTLAETGAIDSFENNYRIHENIKIAVAHPLEMDDVDIAHWQKYFTTRKLKQPFEQIWEPKIKHGIKPNRYTGIMIPYFRFLHQEKHGITVNDYDFHNEIEIRIQGCEADIERIDWARHSISVKDRFEIKSFGIETLDRRTNHIVYYLDKCTIYGQIEQDDERLLQNIEGYTVAQIDSFLKFAIEKGSIKWTAALLNFKNEHFADFADVDEFTLDF